MMEKCSQRLYKFKLMMKAHELDFPLFDDTWSWSGASVLLRTEEHLILIKRSLSMPTHPGQMAFIGGYKKSDELHPFEVAQREFEEESAHHRDAIKCVGVLRPVYTARGQPIVPVVAELMVDVQTFLQQAKSNGEWDHMIALPWDKINRPEFWNYAEVRSHSTYQILMTTIAAKSYLHHAEKNDADFVLWGATARMLWTYLALYYQSSSRFNHAP
jgi:coenzyme A diphosphatase NUDT7